MVRRGVKPSPYIINFFVSNFQADILEPSKPLRFLGPCLLAPRQSGIPEWLRHLARPRQSFPSPTPILAMPSLSCYCLLPSEAEYDRFPFLLSPSPTRRACVGAILRLVILRGPKAMRIMELAIPSTPRKPEQREFRLRATRQEQDPHDGWLQVERAAKAVICQPRNLNRARRGFHHGTWAAEQGDSRATTREAGKAGSYVSAQLII